jgi:hypothetical protein
MREKSRLVPNNIGVPSSMPVAYSAFMGAITRSPTMATLRPMIVVVDHHVAHVYRDIDGSRPKQVDTIQPLDPHHFHHHLVHKKAAHYRGDRVPEDPVFFQDIAAALTLANEIVLIGHGVGKSNAAEALSAYLKSHVPLLAKRVLSVETADLSALTEPEIELIAKRHMITVV